MLNMTLDECFTTAKNYTTFKEGGITYNKINTDCVKKFSDTFVMDYQYKIRSKGILTKGYAGNYYSLDYTYGYYLNQFKKFLTEFLV